MHGRSSGQFPLLEQFMGVRMGTDFSTLRCGEVAVIESPRRLNREQSYGFVHALWCVWLEDGRSVASVPPGTGDAVLGILADVHPSDALSDRTIETRLKNVIDEALVRTGMQATDRVLRSLHFACNGDLLRRHASADLRRLTDDGIPRASGLKLPTHCFPDGVVYGVVADGTVVSCAHAHRTGVMEDQVADVAVDTAPEYRRRGYAKAVVSAVVEHVGRSGGEARYGCSAENDASVATALSVGFVRWGRNFVLSAPARLTGCARGLQ